MANILFFGDSITFGAWDEKGGWVNRIREDITKKIISSNFNYYHQVYQLGIPGENTTKLLKRLETEIKSRANYEEIKDIILIFAIGINDSQVYNVDKSTKVSLGKFKENLKRIKTIAKSYTEKIIFIGLTPVDENLVNPIPWKTEFSYKNDSIKNFNYEIDLFCKKNNILFTNIFNNWIECGYRRYLIDGLHPNSDGHKKLYEQVSNFLKEKNII